jgi:hypothetical protein
MALNLLILPTLALRYGRFKPDSAIRAAVVLNLRALSGASPLKGAIGGLLAFIMQGAAALSRHAHENQNLSRLQWRWCR